MIHDIGGPLKKVLCKICYFGGHRTWPGDRSILRRIIMRLTICCDKSSYLGKFDEFVNSSLWVNEILGKLSKSDILKRRKWREKRKCEIFVCSSADKHLGAKCSQEEKPELNQKRKRSKRGERAAKRGGGGWIVGAAEAGWEPLASAGRSADCSLLTPFQWPTATNKEK